MKKKVASIVIELTIYAFVIMFSVFIMPKYVFAKAIVDGHSMENTLHDKDRLMEEKVSYQFHDPQRFDVIIFHSPVEDKDWVKRVIGLPGETVQIKEGKVYINGQELEGDVYGKAKIDYAGDAKKPFVVPANEYFVMGDNRIKSNSWDSRYEEVGAIPRKLIEGKVLFRVYPFDKIGTIQ